MADQYAPRTFPNNPEPIPAEVLKTMAPMRPVAPAEAPAPMPAAAIPSEPPPPATMKDADDESEFWVSAPDKNGRYKIFNTTPDGENHELGRSDNPELSKILDSVVKRNEFTGAWRGVPKDVAMSFARGEVGIAEHVHKMWDAGKAGTADGMIWWQAMSGKMTDEEAKDKSDPELLKMQVDSPLKPWSDGRLASMVSTVPWALGVTAKAAPSMIAGIARGTELLPFMAAGAAALAATGGPAGLAALATPAGFATVLGASSAAGMFDFTFKVTTGSIYGELRREDVDPALAKRLAPIAGIVAGALEVVGFKFFTAAAKRTFANKVLGDERVKAIMAKWYINYLKETGAEAGIESAQTVVEEYTKRFALAVDGKAESMKTHTEIGKAALLTGVESFVAFGIMKAPMAGVEGVASRTPKKEEAKTPATPAAVVEGVAQEMPAPKVPTAPALEQELVKAEPEVAAALTELNTELDPLAEDAAIEYDMMGEELAGNENVEAAVAAKVEALRSEMNDILAEEDNSPLEQRRVVEIQNEIGLLEGMQEKMGAVEEVVTPSPRKPIIGAKARVQKQIVAAREKKLVTDLNNTLAMVKELEASRTRLEKAGRSVVFINDQIAKLMGEVYKIDEARAKLAETGEVAKGEALELKPATLASITEAAFKEGRADVITKRATLIKEVAEQNSLSDRDIKTLIKNRNLGTMTDFEFKTFVDKVREDAKVLADKKQAAIELRAAQEAKGLKREESLRRINNLPPVSKMTAEQMRQYAELIEGYEAGETFWTPKRIGALKETRWKGAETMEDVLRMAADLFNVPLEDLAKVTMSELDRFRYDTSLARRHPLYNFMVDEVKLAALKNDAAYFVEREEHFKLAEAAAKSRAALDAGKKSVWERLKAWAAPQQKEVMAYLEAETAEEKTAAAAALTPEELKLAQYQEDFYRRAYDYLLAGGDLKSSRFADGGYVFHARRPLSEILRDIRETGVRAAVSDFMTMWKTDETRFAAVDSATGKALGLRKFFRQTLFRSGELTPSKNVVRSTDVYMRQFFKKKALDEAVPSVETLTMAVASLDKTEQGKQMGAALQSFVKEYLNAKKGKAAITGIAQGGKIDALIRFSTNLVSLHMMGFNSIIQIAAPVGETAAKIPVLGMGGLAKAIYRGRTKQGRAISAKYKFFTGEGVIEEFVQPGQNIETKIAMLAYGMFKWSRANTMRDLILGNMTDAEFAAGTISNERLAEIKKMAGRWIDVGDAKSIMGTTSAGKSYTQFKSWAIPIMSSSLDIINSTIKAVKTGDGKALSPMQRTELVRVMQSVTLVAFVSQMAGEADKDDDSYLGRLKFTVMRELSTLIQAVNPMMFLGGPVAAAWLTRLAQNIQMWITLQRSKTTGELMGYQRLKKQLTPAIVRQMTGGDKKPKGPPKPVKFKRENRD